MVISLCIKQRQFKRMSQLCYESKKENLRHQFNNGSFPIKKKEENGGNCLKMNLNSLIKEGEDSLSEGDIKNLIESLYYLKVVNDFKDDNDGGKKGTLNFPENKYIVFVDNGDALWNNFINIRYDDLKEALEKLDYRFIFMPKFMFRIENYSYHDNPELTNAQFNINDNNFEFKADFTKLYADSPLLNFLVKKCVNMPSLVYYEGFTPESFYFRIFDLGTWDSTETSENKIKIFLKYCSPSNFNNPVLNKNLDNQDHQLMMDGAVTTLLNSIKQDIETLRKFGISKKQIDDGMKVSGQLSQLVITDDHRILLPFYELEVAMSPLPKSLYILFLRHPEGINFKDMPDYFEELLEIYMEISPRANLEKIRNSIERLCNPLDNSINEKCSRIKEAFTDFMSEELAQMYCITGQSRSKRGINLDSKFIHFNVKCKNAQDIEDKYYTPLIFVPQALRKTLKGK